MMLVTEIILVGFLILSAGARNVNGRRPLSDSYTKLCASLTKKAHRQRLKLCHAKKNHDGALRLRRDTNSSLFNQSASTKAPQIVIRTPEKRNSYECHDTDASKCDPYGYSRGGYGIPLNVSFTRDNDWWRANVTWSPPIAKKNQSKCVGYRIKWQRSYPVLFPVSNCQDILNENVTSFLIDSSMGFRKDNCEFRLSVSVYPLPAKDESRFIEHRRAFLVPVPACPASTGTVNTNKSSPKHAPTGTVNTNKSSLKHESCTTKLIVAVIATALGFISLFFVYHIQRMIRRGHQWLPTKDYQNESFDLKGPTHYISYYPDDDNMTHTVIRIANWLTNQDINVMFDKFNVITNGKGRWCERQYSLAKKVIIVVSPGYLKVCKLEEGKEELKKLCFIKDQLAFREILNIEKELSEKPFGNDRFVVVLVKIEVNELPWWMKRLHVYKYNEKHGLDQEILKVLIKGTDVV